MAPRRRLPPILSDAERIEAARIAADRLTADLRERELARSAWSARPPTWDHFVDSAGQVISRKRP